VRFLLCATAIVAACSSSSGDSPTNDIANIMPSLQVMGMTATVERHAGDPPVANGGPAASATGPTVVINGGTATLTLDGQATFTSVVVSVTGASGYYVVTLPSPVSSVDLIATLAQGLDQPTLTFRVAGANGGQIGDYDEIDTTVMGVGTGDLQVSISWDVDSDVDLHVIDPDGAEIYYDQTDSPSGGVLDLDSNAACLIDHVRNENITWATAPSGTYTVLVDYYDSCNVDASHIVVTVKRKGHDAQTFTDTLTGAGDQGGLGSGTQVTTFTMP
jgi:hypothetical protein